MLKTFTALILFWLSQIPTISSANAEPPPPLDSAELERQIHEQINRERRNRGLTPLDDDERLIAIARNHSLDMAHHHFFNHVNLRGEYPSDRARRLGWNQQKQIDSRTFASGVAENIFLTRLYDKIYTIKQNGIPIKKEYEWLDMNRLARTIVQGWLNSPHHRKVMLSPQYDRQGIGVVVSGYDVYVTENLF
jgi:uncharacterized protein YkwD